MTEFKSGDRVRDLRKIDLGHGDVVGEDELGVRVRFDNYPEYDDSEGDDYHHRGEDELELVGLAPGEFHHEGVDWPDATSPAHYDFNGVQVIDITRHLSFPLGNVVKYVTRAGRKGDALEDLLKARKYLDWAIEDAER